MTRHYQDLREFLAILEGAGYLHRIPRAIDKDRLLMPLVRWQYCGLPAEERRAFFFEQVTDSKGRSYPGGVAVGVLGACPEVYALAMGCRREQIIERWTEAQRDPIAPLVVESGPVQEVMQSEQECARPGQGLEGLPIPVVTPGFDPAPFITAGYVVTRDLESGVHNVGTYRAMLKGPNCLGMSVAPAQHIGIHFRQHRERGLPLPVAVVLGGPPAVGLVSVAKLSYGVEEYGVAGGIAGRAIEMVRCQTSDLLVPAWAEIVIEGEIATSYLEPEGPFGEFTGYMGGRMMNGVLQVHCITHRRSPVFQAFVEGVPSESGLIRRLGYEAMLTKLLKYDCNIPSIIDVAVHESSGSRKLVVIRLRKTHPAQPWQALNAAVALDPTHGKILIAVDEDIDPADADAVNWAMSFRMQPHLDLRVTAHKYAGLDPSSAPPDAPSDVRRFPPPIGCSALLIDATRKWAYPPVALPAREYMEEARALWQELGLPPLKPKATWYGYSLGHWSQDNEEEAALAAQGDYHLTAERLRQQRQSI